MRACPFAVTSVQSAGALSDSHPLKLYADDNAEDEDEAGDDADTRL